MRKYIAIALCALMAFSILGCTSNNSSNEPDYADDEAMQILANGWEKRIQASEGIDSSNDNYAAMLKESVKTELDTDSALKDRQFQDSMLQEKVIAYINLLDKQIELLNSYPVDDPDFYTKWEEAYDERAQLIRIFVNEYGFEVDKKYQNDLDGIIASGTAAQEKADQQKALERMVSKAKWKSKNNSGWYTYTAVIKNTSDYDYENVSVVLNMYDKKGVKTESFANVSSWKKDEKAKFEVYGNDTKAKKLKAEIEYYSVVD